MADVMLINDEAGAGNGGCAKLDGISSSSMRAASP